MPAMLEPLILGMDFLASIGTTLRCGLDEDPENGRRSDLMKRSTTTKATNRNHNLDPDHEDH